MIRQTGRRQRQRPKRSAGTAMFHVGKCGTQDAPEGSTAHLPGDAGGHDVVVALLVHDPDAPPVFLREARIGPSAPITPVGSGLSASIGCPR